MSIAYQILGTAGRDNALLVYLHTGQAVFRLLFDCGDGCLAPLPFAEIQRIDHLFFSHLHMDHVGGFDAFFRCTYNRTARPNLLWGPPESARILQHRFQGFMWNLHGGKEAAWLVQEAFPTHIRSTRYELAEAFAVTHDTGEQAFDGVLLRTADFTVEAVPLNHLIPSLGFIVRESPRLNIDRERLDSLRLPPGPWLKQVKSPAPGQEAVKVDGTTFTLEELRVALLTEQPGESVAYLTDFLPDAASRARLLPRLQGCKAIVCESAYRAADTELARQNYHLTTVQAAELAREAGAGKLVLIHLSDRYPPEEWPDMLREAQEIFPAAEFPRSWGVG